MDLILWRHADAADGQQVLRAAEITAGSFLAACRENSPQLLKLPSLLPLKMHSYE